tara:strand:- start:2442 stop:3680 length:1239 start_codon:yes stop_codon:yes gene_type:complete
MVEEKGIVVCSLFDGCSGTQIALKNLGIKVDKYFASEIDKYAIQITQKNFPNTIQLGDIKNIKGKDLPEIDLIVAGSPCQGFSFAGKQLAFDDPRSALFFEFIRVLKEVKPKYFLLENVRMKKEFQAVISEQVSNIYPECTSGGLFGIEPILINSALLSAQNRNRLYWTNIPGIEQPEDLGIVLRDVLETKSTECKLTYNTPKKLYDIPREILKDNERQRRVYSKNGKSPTVLARSDSAKVETYDTPKQVGTATDIKGYDIIKRVYSENGKSPTLTTMGGGHREPKVAVKGGAIRGRYNDEGKTNQHLEIRKDAKSNAITTVQKDSIAVSKIRDKSKTVRSGGRLSYDRHEWDSVDELHWRKLTPLECERLQTVPDNYTEGVSNTQRYKMLGNGFTVKVIEHILKNMEKCNG